MGWAGCRRAWGSGGCLVELLRGGEWGWWGFLGSRGPLCALWGAGVPPVLILFSGQTGRWGVLGRVGVWVGRGSFGADLFGPPGCPRAPGDFLGVWGCSGGLLRVCPGAPSAGLCSWFFRGFPLVWLAVCGVGGVGEWMLWGRRRCGVGRVPWEFCWPLFCPPAARSVGFRGFGRGGISPALPRGTRSNFKLIKNTKI